VVQAAGGGGSGGGGRGGPVRRLALALHTDDARVRASLVGDGGALGETIAALSAGTLSLRAHSNKQHADGGGGGGGGDLEGGSAGGALSVAALLDCAVRGA